MHRFERCKSTESMIGDQGGSKKSWRVEQFWEQKVQKGQDVFFATSITMSPASGRQKLKGVQKGNEYRMREVAFRHI